MPTPQRLPIVDDDDGQWGSIINQWLQKEHYDDGTDNAVNGGHKKITIRAGTTVAGTAPLKFTSGSLLTAPEAGALEFLTDKLYFTQTTSAVRKVIASYDDSSGATGDVYYRDSSGYFTRLPIGSSTNVLTVSGGLPAWSAAAGGGDASTNTSSSVDSEVALFSGTAGKTLKRATGSGIASLTSGVLSAVSTVGISQGGTGQSSASAGFDALAPSQTANSGKFLTTNGTTTSWGTPASGGLTWSEVTGTSQSAAVNTGYILNNAGLVTVTLPSTAAVGDILQLAGKGAGLWKLAQNVSGIVHFGSTNTTTGTGGSIAGTNRYDCANLVCIVANNEWVVTSSVGNFTVV